MTHRVLCPCAGTTDFHWARTGPAISLGQLFLVLGGSYTAAEIYHFYRTLRIVAVKRRKAFKNDPASASKGTLPSVLSGTTIRKEFSGFKDQLVEEYAALHGFDLPPVDNLHGRHVLFEAAVQYVHATLLQDLSPPWIGSEFSQALPGNGVLCRYLKPTFLRWEASQVHTLFGEQVKSHWDHVLRAVSADMAAVVARPLYVCTALKPDGRHCMAVASMSPLMKHKSPHQHFRCKSCKTNAAGATPDEPPLRVLRMYVQVLTESGRRVTMRTAPMHVLLQAPRVNTQWGVGQNVPHDIADVRLAWPWRVATRYNTMYQYDTWEGYYIWAFAGRYTM